MKTFKVFFEGKEIDYIADRFIIADGIFIYVKADIVAYFPMSAAIIDVNNG